MTKPATIADIAAKVGVSQGAVSFALNNRPGVSELTRQRVKEAALELGFVANPAARALSNSSAWAVGLVICHDNPEANADAFYFQFLVGLERSLRKSNYSLVFELVHNLEEEIATYRRWWAQKRVNGVVLFEPQVQDSRLKVLGDLNMPFVSVGTALPGGSAVSICEEDFARLVVEHAARQGFEVLVYVGGNSSNVHSCARREALKQLCVFYGLDLVFSADQPRDVSNVEQFAALQSEKVLRDFSLLKVSASSPGSLKAKRVVFVYENELLTMGGLATIESFSLSIPQQVGIISWENSRILAALNPSITALSRDVVAFGKAVGATFAKALGDSILLTNQYTDVCLVHRAST